jgi:hypothetical protein
VPLCAMSCCPQHVEDCKVLGGDAVQFGEHLMKFWIIAVRPSSGYYSALKKEAVTVFETSTDFHQATQCHTSEDTRLPSHCRCHCHCHYQCHVTVTINIMSLSLSLILSLSLSL